jgi:hypothetical protein
MIVSLSEIFRPLNLAFSGEVEEKFPIDTAMSRLVCWFNKHAKRNIHRDLDVVVGCDNVSIEVRREFNHNTPSNTVDAFRANS